MVKKNVKTNPTLIALIHELKKQANENDAPIWKDIAVRLEKPLKNWPEINLTRISKYTNEKLFYSTPPRRSKTLSCFRDRFIAFLVPARPPSATPQANAGRACPG